MRVRPVTDEEKLYVYSQSSQIEAQIAHIGYLRGDFGNDGSCFYTTWFDRCRRYKTDDFKAEFDEVINALRSSEYGILKSRTDMEHFVKERGAATIDGAVSTEYGIRVDTDDHAYLFRCNPMQGQYNFYCYCYVKKWLDRNIEKAKQGIRFIDPHYKELFRIPDGGSIIVTDKWGDRQEYTCRFIDEYHTEVGYNLYHICEFAERMYVNQAKYEPKEAWQPDGKDKRKGIRDKEQER